MTDRELMQQALDALERYGGVDQRACDAEEALRERLAQPEQQPLGWRWKERVNGELDYWVVTSCEPPPYAVEKQPLYTAPRQWQGLTDEEKAELDAKYGDDMLAHLDAVEAKLKEKNG